MIDLPVELPHRLIAAGLNNLLRDECLFGLLVVLMPVKEASDLPLQLSCLTRLTHGNRVVKKVPLNIRGQIIPVHNYCLAKAPQNMLLLFGQGDPPVLFAL